MKRCKLCGLLLYSEYLKHALNTHGMEDLSIFHDLNKHRPPKESKKERKLRQKLKQQEKREKKQLINSLMVKAGYCPKCGGDEYTLVPQTFQNGMIHIRKECSQCGKFIQYVQQTPENVDKVMGAN